jgi:iron complex outermembrane receptor protein
VEDSLSVKNLEDLDYRNTAPGIFVQDEYAASRKVALAASARVDFQKDYGAYFNPRVSVLVRPGSGLSLRVSAGTGYAPPVPITEETEEVGFSHLLPLAGVTPERAQSASVDLGWTQGGLELSGTLFASRVEDALQTRASAAQPDMLEIVNADGPTKTTGSELIVRYTHGPWHAIGTYTALHATEPDPNEAGTRDVPLTPRREAEVAAILESEPKGRIGAELSYTGTQSLAEDPYRETSVATWEVSVLGEVHIQDFYIFVNAMNLTDVRQTRYNPLLLPSQAPDGRWTTDVWAPLDGRVINLGVRFEF